MCTNACGKAIKKPEQIARAGDGDNPSLHKYVTLNTKVKVRDYTKRVEKNLKTAAFYTILGKKVHADKICGITGGNRSGKRIRLPESGR